MRLRLPSTDPKQMVLRIQKTVMRAPKPIRILMGGLLMIGGLFGFLPILGFWMIPLGIMILAVDVPWVRRRWRRFLIWLEKRRRRRKAEAAARDSSGA
jgi:hypothetical protein